ncbi:hypothetical protein NC653_017193 [Populus alba x Populus x berolinensis]|uniref:Uncharacterized protein n=1 Tax=Populus alba x Populus x berolinensis TaxID=444605 RepID=A0AAD6QPZ0_9ROSI|nr:hypothetical protein NC653_017193 [Populus alba x Populus x berolinensis]
MMMMMMKINRSSSSSSSPDQGISCLVLRGYELIDRLNSWENQSKDM